jgi:hypothetical protein
VNLSDLYHRGSYFVSDHSTGILTGIGVAGTVATAYLTGKAVLKADRILAEEQAARHREFKPGEGMPHPEMSGEEKFKLVWHVYIPPVAAGTSTILAIIMANRLASKEAAALTAAYVLSERSFQEYKEKVVEKMGETKEQAVRDDMAKSRVAKQDPPAGITEVILAGTGDVLCFDILTGRYFVSSMEKIRQAENKINFEIVNHQYASLSTFYDEIGLPPTGMSDMLGWNLENRLEIRFSTQLTSDQRPCITIDFTYPPMPDYGKHVY